MPLSQDERRRRGDPVNFVSASSSAITSNITFSSSRERLAPMQKWDPPAPKVTWGFGERPMSKRRGSSNTSSSKLAEAKYRPTRSPWRTNRPATSVSSSAVRWRTTAGEAQRRISSTAVAGPFGPPSFPLVRMLQKRQHAVGDRLPGGLVAGDGEDHEEERELFAVQALAIGVGLDEPTGDVPEIVLDPRLGCRVRVGEHLDDP